MATVGRFLGAPEVFEAEMQRRNGLTGTTKESFRREQKKLGRSERHEREAEAKLLRLA